MITLGLSSRNRHPQGFSLIELMAVLAIVVILIGVGVPSFVAFLQEIRISATANDFFSSIHLARTEAIRRNTRVDMVPADDGGDWSKGWVVFVDENANQRPDAREQVIFSRGPAPKPIRITANLTDSTVQYIAYNGTGRSRTNSSSYRTQFGTFTFNSDGKVRKIKLNFLGRPRLCNPDIEKHTC